MRQVMRIIVMVMLVVAVATMGYAQTGAMSPEQMKMMSGQMKTMSDQMKSGKMTADQTKMMAEHMQMMADRMKDGQRQPHPATTSDGGLTTWAGAKHSRNSSHRDQAEA